MIKKLIFFSTLIYLSAFVLSSVVYQPIRGEFNITAVEKPTFETIIKNNSLMILALILGCFTFGATSFTNLIINGLQMGLSLSSMIKDGYVIEPLYLIVPHSIFEIPAIIIAGAAGFKIPYEITRYLAGKKDQILTRQDIKEYLTLALISIALIIIAAWVEANITMRIAESIIEK